MTADTCSYKSSPRVFPLSIPMLKNSSVTSKLSFISQIKIRSWAVSFMSLLSSSASEYNWKVPAFLFNLLTISSSISSTRRVTVLRDKLIFFFQFVFALRTQDTFCLHHTFFVKDLNTVILRVLLPTVSHKFHLKKIGNSELKTDHLQLEEFNQREIFLTFECSNLF